MGTGPGVYVVLINEGLGRILVSGRVEDRKLVREGWKIIYSSEKWEDAFRKARSIAEDRDYVLEWYLEEEKEVLKATVN